jgi:hypothetical protein
MTRIASNVAEIWTRHLLNMSEVPPLHNVLTDNYLFFLTCPWWQVVVEAVLFLPWQEKQAKAWKQTCVPRIHTKECGYLGLPQDTNMHCKHLNRNPILASSVLEGQGGPWNHTPADAPETMRIKTFYNVTITWAKHMSRSIRIQLWCHAGLHFCLITTWNQLSPKSSSI